jgi:hypothetical protein
MDFYGTLQNRVNRNFRLNSLELNPINYTGLKDWEFSFVYGGEFSKGNITGNLYSVSAAKSIGNHYFYIRYTPGIQKEFLFRNSSKFYFSDTVSSLGSKYNFQEKFGFGYSLRLNNRLQAGLTFRFFSHKKDAQDLKAYFSDSVNSIYPVDVTESINSWSGDVGFNYAPAENFSLSIAVKNLFHSEEKNFSGESVSPLKTDKTFLFGALWQPGLNISTSLFFETQNSFEAGINTSLSFLGGSLTLGLSACHDEEQTPFVSAVMPGINYANGPISISINCIKYMKCRPGVITYEDFLKDRFSSISNSRYSYDKVLAAINFALDTRSEKQVQFEDIKIVQDIYPTLQDNYIATPYAVATVKNLTTKPVTVIPSSFIKEINTETVSSPSVIIAPGAVAEVPFFTIINSESEPKKRPVVAQADFFLSTDGKGSDDKFQKPILINTANSWDGSVNNLKYFVKHDPEFSSEYARGVLSRFKQLLDTIPSELLNFNSAKILFNNFVKNMVYVADPLSSADIVQFPSETIRLKGGDCDDFAVAFSSILESAGIQTAFIDYKGTPSKTGHVCLLVNTGLTPEQASMITVNDSKFYLIKNAAGNDEIWLPLETTELSDFDKAWENGSEKFTDEAVDNFGLAKGEVEIIEIL